MYINFACLSIQCALFSNKSVSNSRQHTNNAPKQCAGARIHSTRIMMRCRSAHHRSLPTCISCNNNNYILQLENKKKKYKKKEKKTRRKNKETESIKFSQFGHSPIFVSPAVYRVYSCAMRHSKFKCHSWVHTVIVLVR